MGKSKNSRSRRRPKKDYSKLIALCAVAFILVTTAVLLTVLPASLRQSGPSEINNTPGATIQNTNQTEKPMQIHLRPPRIRRPKS